MRRLILASASPARLASLRDAGLDPEVVVSGVDESVVTEPEPERLCQTLAELKATAVAERTDGAALVLGCDSVLDFDGRIHGKPADADEAAARWRAMRGKSGVLHSGHCLVDTGAGRTMTRSSATVVRFADVTDAEITAYVATGEPLGLAGAFAIDGRSAPFVERIDGDPGTVVGVSLPLLRRMLAEWGIAITSLWRGSGQ